MYQSWKNHLRDKSRYQSWKHQDKFSRVYSNRRSRRVINIALTVGHEESIDRATSDEAVKRADDYWSIFD